MSDIKQRTWQLMPHCCIGNKEYHGIKDKKVNKKAETKSLKPLWNWDKLEKGDIFSSVCYY